MLDIERPEVALRGERGIDIFLRSEDAQRKRARFRCVATLVGATENPPDGDRGAAPDGDWGATPNQEPRLILHEPIARRDRARLGAAARELVSIEARTRPFSLVDPAGWPRAADWPDPLRLFLYHELFRAWQVADMAWRRLESRLSREGEAPTAIPGIPETPDIPDTPGALAALIAPLYDFNRLSAGTRAARWIQPVLHRRVTAPGWRDERSGGTGYALRMLGDLCLRAGEPALALACFETSAATGDNPFRRRKCIEAARAAGDADAVARHIAAFRDRWPLPDDLAAVEQGARA